VSFLAPLAFLAGLLAVPVILLYMLRLRRREVVVSSTFLWQQILRDREANTPWQRLRRNLLLFLQLLLLALLVFALARPFVTVPAVSAGRIALILDASASMNAADMNGGTRLDEAKNRALAAIDSMSEGDRMTVIRAGSSADALTPLTDDRTLLRQAVSAVQAGYGTADWGAALTLAAANAGSGEDFTTLILSDGGGLQPREGVVRLPAIPGEPPQYDPIGTAGDNVAITAFSARALPGEPPQLFAQITNFGDQDADVVFTLYDANDDILTSDRLTVRAGESLPVVADVPNEDINAIRAGLTPPTDSAITDYLADDDSAYAIIGDTASRRVLVVGEGSRFLEQVLRSLPGVQVFTIQPGQLPTRPYDLYVFDGWLPDELPNADMLIINPPNSTPLFTVGAVQQRPENADQPDPTANIRVDSNDPRMTYVDFSTISLLRFSQVAVDWAEPLIEADGGALLLAGETGGRQVAILPFALNDSNLPLDITFPILMSSLLDWFAPQGIVQQNSVKVGETVTLTPGTGISTVRVTLPDGSTREYTYNGAPILFPETDQTGFYTVDSLRDGEIVESALFAVNLFEADESTIEPYPSITLGDQTITPAVEVEEFGQREFWGLLALLGLIILLIEWVYYHRRQRAPVRWRALVGRTP